MNINGDTASKINCHWVGNRLEAYSYGDLTEEEQQLAQLHIENCEQCRTEVQSLSEIDPLVRKFLQHRLALAHAPRTPLRVRQPVAVMAFTLAGAAVVVAVLIAPAPSATPPSQAPPVAFQPETAEPAVDPKAMELDPSTVISTKPQPDLPSVQPVLTTDQTIQTPSTGKTDFAIKSPAGYIRTLENYRGRILLVGVWSAAQPESVANLERLNRTFGRDTRFTVLGVSTERQTNPAGTTFQVFYNHDSRLLGARESEYLLIDPAGVERLRGSLAGDGSSLEASIRDAVEKMGKR